MIPAEQAEMRDALIEAGLPEDVADRLAAEFYHNWLEWSRERGGF